MTETETYKRIEVQQKKNERNDDENTYDYSTGIRIDAVVW